MQWWRWDTGLWINTLVPAENLMGISNWGQNFILHLRDFSHEFLQIYSYISFILVLFFSKVELVSLVRETDNKSKFPTFLFHLKFNTNCAWHGTRCCQLEPWASWVMWVCGSRKAGAGKLLSKVVFTHQDILETLLCAFTVSWIPTSHRLKDKLDVLVFFSILLDILVFPSNCDTKEGKEASLPQGTEV